MDIFRINLLDNLFEKTENKWKIGRGWPIFKNNRFFLYLSLVPNWPQEEGERKEKVVREQCDQKKLPNVYKSCQKWFH